MAAGMTEEQLAERRRILDEGTSHLSEAMRLDEAGEVHAALEHWTRLRALRKLYRALLPDVPVARSPISGEAVVWPIDTVDLDGWFWDYDGPARRQPPVPATWLCMTGAMRLAPRVPDTLFPIHPGPGAPYVVPRLLEAPGVTAVISQIAVGDHVGWPITYFGPMPKGRPLENLWGTQSFPIYDDENRYRGFDDTPPWPDDWDFDLRPWLESGRLHWVAPGDDSLTLRQGASECPYLDLPGPRTITVIENGEVRRWRPGTESAG
ncbi:hypothetical protein [Thermomonospora umbrina]|uniref:Uncharacterized protein n=1 Tax=Thermomonospora umbrina TaxID=111806 RepID=A0A3D9SN55_9ACTN|nr:hypothetical protein [Thermomonospora umbrina]REE97157.1 hypothetical protein DFJ69_2614 [Thermomonospora umbrina]